MSSANNLAKLEKIAKLMRYYILTATTQADSGHPTSSLSGVELMAGLLFGGCFRYNPDFPDHPNNDRLIFSKGHASPLFYSLWVLADRLTEREMMTYRHFGSALEGHPTVTFPYAEAATGSLGQGLSIGVGMALNARLDKLPYRTYVLLGDSEMAEGSQWEAIQIAAHYELDNLVGVVDVNRLGQRGPTMYGHDLNAYDRRISAFGWKTIMIDGHSFREVLDAYDEAMKPGSRPVMIIARTVKGKGVSLVEDKNGWHGKALNEAELREALAEIGPVDKTVRGAIAQPENRQAMPPESAPVMMIAGTIEGKGVSLVEDKHGWHGKTLDEAGLQKALAEIGSADKIMPPDSAPAVEPLHYEKGKAVATRNAYGNALKRLYPAFPGIVSLDGEVSNSTMASYFKDAHPDRFFEMFIAEQNMAGAALGFARRGKIPFVSTFAAFMSRAYDQIRMSQYSDANIKFVGSHAGVEIGLDGPSQMGLEDIAFFRTIRDGVVFYPSDAVSTEKIVEQAARYRGMVYIRTTRGAAPVIYDPGEDFPIGGCKVLRRSGKDRATIIGAGVTLHEALAACDALAAENIPVRLIDLYCIKPLDEVTLRTAARETGMILTVEDHYPEGGLGEAVRSALWDAGTPVRSLAVRKKPKTGKPRELLDFEEISRDAIVRAVKELTD